MLQTRLLFNPVAGRFASKMLVRRAVDRLEADGWQVELVETEGGQHTIQLARQAAEQGLAALFVAGGDGTIGKAVAGLVGSQTALGVLPAGTSNVWARELSLHGLAWTHLFALEESAARFAEARVQVVDVGFCNGNPFLLWAGVGLDGLIVHQLEANRQGHRQLAEARYVASLLKTASNWDGMPLEIEADGQRYSGHYLLAVVSNIRNYAGGLATLSPHACLDDGVMDLWLFAGETIGEAIQHAANLLFQRHTQSDRVSCIPFHSLSIKSDASVALQLDGDPSQAAKMIEVEVQRQSLRVLVPPGVSEKLFTHPPEYSLADQ